MLVFKIRRMSSFYDVSGGKHSIFKNQLFFIDLSVKVPVKVVKLCLSLTFSSKDPRLKKIDTAGALF